MSVKWRQRVEREIATAVIKSAITAGWDISVFDGEETTLHNSKDQGAILKAMFTTDEDRLDLQRGKETGWVFFVYGNDGYDVINDYTVNLEPIMGEADKLSNEYAN